MMYYIDIYFSFIMNFIWVSIYLMSNIFDVSITNELEVRMLSIWVRTGRIDQNCEFKFRKQKCEFKNFGQAEKLFLLTRPWKWFCRGGWDPYLPLKKHLQGRLGGSPAPTKWFSVVGDPPTRPWKTIFRGGSRAHPCKSPFLAAKSRGGCAVRP